MENYTIKLLVALGFILSTISASPTTISAPPFSENSVHHPKDSIKSIFGHCLHKKDVVKCLKRRVVDVIDDVTQSNDPLSVELFNLQLSLNKNLQFKGKAEESDSSRSFEDVLSQKLKNLVESRVMQVKVSEDVNEDAVGMSGNILEEARKKKGGGGGKHGMMMSGIGLMAFFAQIFLSKVAFMSGAALLLAKIALLFSALTSLKKSSGSSGGGEHVVYAADVGKQGWQRSIHTMSPVVAQQQPQISDDLAYSGHSTLPSYDGV